MGIVYTVYMEGLGVSMETLIGNMVGYVQVPPPGGLQVSVLLHSLMREVHLILGGLTYHFHFTLILS